MQDDHYDLVIVGGGINGCGIAADAAGRGLRTLLVEKADLANATSSSSSKLIHGGLRYLEQLELRLVREALAEREVLLAAAPHVVRPLRFVLPHVPGMRSRTMLRIGLKLYDCLATRRTIPASAAIDLSRDPAGRALKKDLVHGFAYHDCSVDDSRLVVLNARAAADRGATILTRTRATGMTGSEGFWRIRLEQETSSAREVRARALVNAAGPWAARVAASAMTGLAQEPPHLRLVKGSHIVVPRLPGAEDAYLMQSADGRVVFALPFEGRFTLIGTTDVPVDADSEEARITPDEERYLIDVANRYFAVRLAEENIVWRFSGVRPLIDEPGKAASKVSRDYRLDLVPADGAGPLLNCLGGKITTYRRLAEAALDKLEPYIAHMKGRWTGEARLPGGDFGAGGPEAYRQSLARQRPGIPASVLDRLVRLYGTRADDLLGDAKSIHDLGRKLGGGLSEREVCYLKESEWARTPEDVLWRRTKAGLHMANRERTEAAAEIARLL